MKRPLVLTLGLLLAAIAFPGSRSHSATVPVPAPALSPQCTDDMDTIESCPLTGCGEFGDALLNRMKNRVGPVSTPVKATLDNIRGIPEPKFSTGDPRTALAQNESKVVVVQAFLLKAKRQGEESCNCGITGAFNTDIHLVLVDKLPDMEDEDEVAAAERGSVTAEITPRVRRQGHPKWVVKNINDFEGEFVRLTGLMMLDTKHIPQEHQLEGERRNKRLQRATNWELHPVTRFQFCNSSIKKCRQGIGWVDF